MEIVDAIFVLGCEESYFVKEHSDSKNKYTEEDILNMTEFLVDNIVVIFGGNVFKQIVGFPMGTNFAHLIADIRRISVLIRSEIHTVGVPFRT